MASAPLSLQDAIAAWLSAAQAAPVPTPEPTPADSLVDMAKPSQPNVDWRAVALAASGTSQAQAAVQAQAQASGMAQATPWQNMGLRMGGGLAGGMLAGAAAGSFVPVAGTVAGGLIGAAGAGLGAAAGDWVAQGREVASGEREARSPLESLAVGAATAIPGGVLGAGGMSAIPRAIATGLPANAAGSLLVQGAQGQGYSAERTLDDAVFGTTVGAGAGAAFRGATRVAQSPAVQRAVQRLIADERGAVGPLDPLKWNVPVKPATRKSTEGAFRQAPAPIRAEVLRLMGGGPIDAPALLQAAKRGDEAATQALGLLRLQLGPTAAKTKTPTRVARPASPEVDAVAQADAPPTQQTLPGVPQAAAPDAPVVPPAAAAPEPPVFARAPIGTTETPDLRLSTGDAQPKVPSRLAEDTRRHEARLRRLGRSEDEIEESTFVFRHILDDVMGQDGREIVKSNQKSIDLAKELLASGEFVMPKGKAGKMKFSEEDAAAVAYEYAMRDEFLSRIRQRVTPDLRARLGKGDPEAAATVAELSAKYGVDGIDGLERLKYEAGLMAIEAAVADKTIGTAQGRGLQLRRARLSLKGVSDAEFLRAAEQKGLTPKQAMDALDEIDAAGGTAQERRRRRRQMTEVGIQDKWRQVIYTALLSNPGTHGVNFGTTTASILARETLSNTLVTGVDRARSAITGSPRRIATPPAALLGKAYLEGMKTGFETGGFFLRRGYDPNSVAADVDIPLEAFSGRVTGPLMQAPTRLLGAADAFMAQPVYWGEVFRRATAKAMNEGLSGEALAARIEELARTHDIDDDLVKAVNSHVQTVLFKDKPGKLTRWAAQGVKTLNDVGKQYAGGAPLGTMLLPFLTTPASIMRQGFKAAGGGLVTGAMAARAGDSVKATRDVAEAVIGLGLMSALVLNIADGTIGVVGDLPRNEFERESLYAQGKKPWSLQIGNRIFPATSLGPLATPLAIAAAYVQAAKADPKRAPDAFATYVAPALKMITDSTMLKGMSDFLEGIRDRDKADQLVGKVVTMNIPYAGALRHVRDQVDPLLRDPGGRGATARFLQGEPTTLGARVSALGRNVQEQIEAALPGLSTRIRPRIDSFGHAVQRPNSMDRVRGSEVKDDPVRSEIIRLKQAFPSWEDDALYPGNAESALTSLEQTYKKKANSESFMFTERERNLYKVLVGRAVGDTLGAVVAHPDYATLTDEEKADVIRNERKLAARSAVELFKDAIEPSVAPRLSRTRVAR